MFGGLAACRVWLGRGGASVVMLQLLAQNQCHARTFLIPLNPKEGPSEIEARLSDSEYSSSLNICYGPCQRSNNYPIWLSVCNGALSLMTALKVPYTTYLF